MVMQVDDLRNTSSYAR